MKFPLVSLEWDDAQTDTGWVDHTEIKTEHAVAITIGFLVKESSEHVVIASTVGEDGSTNGRIQIPKKMILKRRTMRKA